MRQFLIKNLKKHLQVFDSEFSDRSVNTDPDSFITQLKREDHGNNSNTINNIHILLRAGRSLTIELGESTLDYKEVDIGRKIVRVSKRGEFDSGFDDLVQKVHQSNQHQQMIINSDKNLIR